MAPPVELIVNPVAAVLTVRVSEEEESVKAGWLFTGVGVGDGSEIGLGDSLGAGEDDEGFGVTLFCMATFDHLALALAEERAQINFCPVGKLTFAPTSKFLQY